MRCVALWLIIGLRVGGLVAAAVAPSNAQESDSGRAPTGMVTRPGDLLKEEDGTEFRFAYHPTANRLRLLVPARASAYSSWSASLTREGASNVLARADGRFPLPAAGACVR